MPNTNPQQQQNLQQQQQLNVSIENYRETLSSISEELGKQKRQITAATGEYSKLDSIARQLQSTEKGIAGLTSDQIKKLQEKYEYSIKELSTQATQLARKKGLGKLDEQKIKDALTYGLIDEKEAALLSAKLDKFKTEKSLRDTLNNQLKERVEYEEKVKDLTGATGAAIKGLHDSMDKLGLSSLNNFLQVDKAKEAMEAEADAIARGEKSGGALQVKMAGISTLAKGFYQSMFSAEVVIGFIVKSLAAGSQNMADFQKQTGMSYTSAYKTNMGMQALAAKTNDAFITSEKLNKSYSMLTEQLGVSAEVLGGEALISATNLSERLGMSAEAASRLTQYTRLQGENTEDILGNAVATVGAFNKQNKTAINSKQVMDDVAGASKSMYLNMGKNVEAMAATATKARSLGLSLQSVEKISESLLNFEDSIGKEMEANLLLGGGVNLAKAREYALTGDTAKLTDEIGKQESIRNAFATKNVIAQQAAADALGISKEELAGMAMQNDINILSAEQLKDKYGETSYEAMKSRSASEKFGDAMEKVKSTIGGIIQIFSPLLDGLTLVLNIPFMPQVLGLLIVSKVLLSNFKGIKDSIGGAFKAMSGLKDKIMGSATSVKDKVKDNVDSIKDKVMGGTKPDVSSSAAEDAKDKVGAKSKGGFKQAMRDLAGGLKAMGATGVGKGIFNLLVAGPALVFAVASIPFLLAVAAIGTAAGVGLQGLATGLKALGKAGTGALYGIGLLALLGVAMIPFGIALGQAAPAIEAFGTVITAVFAGIATVIPVIVDGFVRLISAVTNGIGPLLLLGPALFGIAAGLGAIGFAGITSIPGIMALTALSVIAPALTGLANAMGPQKESKSVGEAKSKADEGSLAALEAKLTELIAVVKEGGDVYMDTVKVGKALQLGRTKL